MRPAHSPTKAAYWYLAEGVVTAGQTTGAAGRGLGEKERGGKDWRWREVKEGVMGQEIEGEEGERNMSREEKRDVGRRKRGREREK